MATTTPLYAARIVAFFLAIALSAVSIGAAFHARDESNQSKTRALGAVNKLGLGIKADIDTSDVYNTGIVVGVAQLLLLLTAIVSLVILIVSRSGSTLSKRTLPVQLGAFLLSTLFTFASAIAITVFVATREAKITALLPNGTPVPKALVDKLKAQLGFKTAYTERDYLVFLSIASWFGVLFGLIATVLTVMAWKRSRATQAADSDSIGEKGQKGTIH